MRALALSLTLAACAAPPRPAPAVPFRTTADAPSPRCPDTVAPGDPGKPRRAEILAELAKLDAELDAIDAELAAAAQNQNRSLDDARGAARARKASLDKVQLDATPIVGNDGPVLLTRAVRALVHAMQREQELSRAYGPRNPEMQRATRWTAAMRRAAQDQLANEHAFAQAWIDSLAALPAKAKPDAIYKARLSAIRTTLATPSSESPASVRVAHESLRAASVTLDDLATVVGPKHPDMIAATQRRTNAKAALDAAVADAETDLAARIAAPTRVPDGAAIARRAELAENARALRDEYERSVR